MTLTQVTCFLYLFQMTSLERVVAFTELDNEAPWETEKRPPPDWPRKGMITFDQVNFAYGSDGPLVLKDLNVMFRPNEKVCLIKDKKIFLQFYCVY